MNSKMMAKLMAEKRDGSKKSDMSDNEKSAKMSVLEKLKSEMEAMLGDKLGHSLDGKKKIVISSDSPEGLKMGLSKAEDIMDEDHEDMLPDGLDDHNSGEGFAENESSEDSHLESESAEPDQDDEHKLNRRLKDLLKKK